jgi:ABC-type transport system involved in multi-copper enzyme maturation permease subunit
VKYLAILTDSFREAIDGKVFYFMVGLSLLLAALFGSVSYTPVSPEKEFESVVQTFLMVRPDHGKSMLPRPFAVMYSIRDLKTLREGSKPWNSEYSFILRASDLNIDMEEILEDENAPQGPKKPKPKLDAKANSDFRKSVAFWDSPGAGFARRVTPSGAAVTDEQMIAFVTDQFQLWGNFNAEVTRRPLPGDSAHEFDVRIKPTGDPRGWSHEPTILFGVYTVHFGQPLGKWVYLIQGTIINGFGAWIALLINVVITAFYVPNMMRKGSIDLLLSKPLMRVTLLIYKYLGGLTLMFLTTTVAVGSIWVVMGLRSGIWGMGFMLSILALTFYFSVLYSISVFSGVFTRSPIVAILVTCFFWLLLWAFGVLHGSLDVFKKEPSVQKDIPQWTITTADTLNSILPRTKDLDTLTTKLISKDTMAEGDLRQAGLERITFPSWTEVLGISFGWIAVLLGLASIRFVHRDY